jgi:hypothetical protein
MSDAPTTDPAPPAKGTSPVRLILLLSIFGIALAGLLYDYCVARPASAAAYEKVLAMLEDEERIDLSITPDKVQKEIGEEPSSVEELENGLIEVYSWRSGMPIRKYNLYVVYSGRQMPLLFSASQNARPDSLPPKNTPAREMSEEELDQDRTPMAAGAGGGGPRAGKQDGATEDEDDSEGKDDGDDGEDDSSAEDDGDDSVDEPAKDEPAKEEPKKDDTGE